MIITCTHFKLTRHAADTYKTYGLLTRAKCCRSIQVTIMLCSCHQAIIIPSELISLVKLLSSFSEHHQMIVLNATQLMWFRSTWSKCPLCAESSSLDSVASSLPQFCLSKRPIWFTASQTWPPILLPRHANCNCMLHRHTIL